MVQQDPKDFLGMRVPHRLIEKIDAFRVEYHKHSRTEAIIDLLELALLIVQKKNDIKDPALVDYLRENLYNEKIVDFFWELPQDRLEALYGAIRDAREFRFAAKRATGSCHK